MVSEGTIDDVPAAVELLSRVNPDRIYSAAGFAHAWRSRPERARYAAFKVERHGRLAGWAAAMLETDSHEPGLAFGIVTVDEADRRSGVGAALWEPVEEHLAGIGARRTRTESLDDPAAAAFSGARGFVPQQRHVVVSVDPRRLPAAPVPPPGAEVVPLTAFHADPRPVFELDRETCRDMPGTELDDLVFEEWEQFYWAHPDVDHELSTVVLVDGEPAAFSLLRVDHAHRRALNEMTGTRRDRRGRGLARLAKHAALARAAAAGITSVVTENAEQNAPMRAVNARLGYEPFAVRVLWQRLPA